MSTYATRQQARSTGGLLLRTAILATIVVFFQIGVVSEVPLFGVNVDLSPLLVAFVGLLCGSLLGAVSGFAVGLLVDLALVQTLGVTSLIFTLTGYWAGRLRELRDPQAALTPLLVGASASAVSLVGYSLMEFMLGVDAPVSFELLRQIVLGIVVNTIFALPMWALVRRVLEGALPEDPRRRRRRAYTTGGLSPLARMSAIEPVRRRDPRMPVSPQLALRVAIIGGIAMVLFGVVFFRLWYLQVLSGEQYVQQANANRVRDLPIPAPRGELLDRAGQPIVTSRTTNAVQIVPSALPPEGVGREQLYRQLAALLHLSAHRLKSVVETKRTALPYAPVTVKTDAGPGVLTVLAERQSEFPGVVQQPVTIRSYPYGEMAAQVIGHVDEISKPELGMRAFRGVKQGTIVGQEGLEYYYDRYLRGESGIARVEVNAQGLPVPSRLPPKSPVGGRSLRLTLDLGLQRESEKALTEGIEHAQASGKPANAGAFVALDPRNGQILALGSHPGFDPNRFAKPLTQAEYNSLKGTGSAPGKLTNRAVNGAYPTGSTFKPITAMAALEAGVISPGEGLGAGQCISVSTQQFCNAGKVDYGAVGLVEALKVSSDTYFFETGERSNSHGAIIQNEAHKLGIGQTTGIDLPTEIEGTVPDSKWLAKRDAEELACRRRRHVASCGIVAEIRPWSVGDDMHLAVGQGDLQTDPLQMAVAYSTLANAFNNEGNGTVVTPHLGMEIDEANGSGLVQGLSFPSHHVHLNYEDLKLVMEGIHQAASQQGGTSADVWSGWNQSLHPVYGKTGTAERPPKEDQSWYMCYIPDPKRPIVLAVTVEQGGFGAETAAPIARLMASQWFGLKHARFVAGSSKTF